MRCYCVCAPGASVEWRIVESLVLWESCLECRWRFLSCRSSCSSRHSFCRLSCLWRRRSSSSHSRRSCSLAFFFCLLFPLKALSFPVLFFLLLFLFLPTLHLLHHFVGKHVAVLLHVKSFVQGVTLVGRNTQRNIVRCVGYCLYSSFSHLQQKDKSVGVSLLSPNERSSHHFFIRESVRLLHRHVLNHHPCSSYSSFYVSFLGVASSTSF